MTKLKYNITVSTDKKYIYIELNDFNSRIYTEYDEGLFHIINNNPWTINGWYDKDDRTKPRYIYSNSLKKQFHQLVMDYYYGEGACRAAWLKRLIVDHINNDSHDCRIKNLAFLHKERNLYKGKKFDKDTLNLSPFFSLRVLRNIKNETFQITIGFTIDVYFDHKKEKPVKCLWFLYDGFSFWDVIVDAENMVDELKDEHKLRFDQRKYRFSKYGVEYGKRFMLTEEGVEAGIRGGHILETEEGSYLILEPYRASLLEVPLNENWGE